MTGCTDGTVHHRGNAFNIDRTLVANRPDVEQQRPIEYREVLERRNSDRTRLVACDRTLAASDQLIAALTVGTTGRVRSGRDQRPISSRKAEFHPQWLLFSGVYKYNPNSPNERVELRKHTKGVDTSL